MESRSGSPGRLRILVLYLGGLLALWHCCRTAAQSVALTWNRSPSANIVAYNIYYGALGGAYTNVISTGDVTNVTISGLLEGRSYYFSAAAVNNMGLESPFSSQVTYTVPVPVPALSMTNVTPGMLVSNATFTVMGLLTNSGGVTNVYYSVNGDPYLPAPFSGRQWYASLPLEPGSNTISAYAVNLAGDDSATDTVNIVYVPIATLTVLTNGRAIISPNYNGQSLRIGENYVMRTAPAAGFIFTNWTGSVAGSPFTVYTNKPTLIFEMTNNLKLQANFIDTLKPYLSITNAKSGMLLWTNSQFTVMGVATDDQAVASVNYSFNHSPYARANTSGIHWNQLLTLNPGTNVFSVYAQSTNGNLSVTGTVDLVYAVSNTLTVLTNGRAMIAPNYNGQRLRIGENYVMRTAPAAGFIFTNWTGSVAGSPFRVYTNKPTLIFEMTNNLQLQANFIDTIKPYLSITNAKSSMLLWTNSQFTVMGVATDDEAVASVNYSFNHSPYARANTSGIHWNQLLTLNPGTNVFSVYAQSTNNNLSVTDTVDLVYAVSNTLTVLTNGRAMIAPNYNGQRLRIGENYVIRTAPAAGFIFTNWTGSVAGSPFRVYTNKPTLIFEMTNNLQLQANFIDTIKPYLSITNAKSSMLLWTNSQFTVMGVATDDEAVASVNYSFNHSPYARANTSGIHWNQLLTLNPGTNVFSVYAQSTNNNLSVTDTVDLVYAVSNTLTVLTNGRAMIAPNYNGQRLRIGENYVIRTAPAAGFIFTNWTGSVAGSPFRVYTNKPTLIFEMTNNLQLQANFIDTIKPYLSITNAKSSMLLWTNSQFTVMGVATDDEAVASVNYSFNHSPYARANTSGIHWNQLLTLNPGTNVFSVYAQSTNNNLSVTDTVDLVYAVSNTLTVLTNGRAIISPNYNGQSLRIGENYRMTATAVGGFMFTNWTGVTNGAVVYSNNAPVVMFKMLPNLVMQANLMDTTKPFLSITNVTPGMLWTNPDFTVMGRATDNVAVANVYFSLNHSGWSNAITANNWANWSTNISLNPGTNFLSAYAVDTAGNVSATNTMALMYVVTNRLLITADGMGTLLPDYSNAWLRIGQNYSITARPASGFIVTNWVISTNFIGGITTNNATVQFAMASNLTLQVNFAETAKPALTVMSPVSGVRVTSSVATVTGVAKDNWCVDKVSYQLNNGPWRPVATTDGFTNWTSSVQLVAGTNTFRTYAVNHGGNHSATNTVDIISANTFKLQFGLVSRPESANGFGFNLDVSPGVNGHIEVSSNLVDWTVMTNFVGTDSVITIYDPAASKNAQRFYRAVVP